MPTTRRPTYADLVKELERAIECIAEASASLALSGRLRWRLIRCTDRLRSVIERARIDD